MGIMASRRVAWVAVRGKPSRMKEAEGRGERVVVEGERVVVEEEGERVVVEEEGEEEAESQFLERSLARMRRRIMSSGTRLPCFMADSASRPAPGGGGMLLLDYCSRRKGRFWG